MDKAFIIEEILDDSATDATTAAYSGNFNEYKITVSKHMQGFYIISDIVKNRDETNIFDNSIKMFVFKDCVKSFDELILNLESNPKNKVRFSNSLTIDNGNISDIKVYIFGFDETKDSFLFDPNKFPRNAVYKYRISKDEFHAHMSLNLDQRLAKNFIESFAFSSDYGFENKKISVIINEIYRYEIL
ncbi:DUF5416 domain-containing protein [Campylobacter fetus]|nr:DUF5416 domain-containing protein [Campylobacter fetus]